MATKTLTILPGARADATSWDTSNFNNADASHFYLSYNTSVAGGCSIRFPLCLIPRNATITSAIIRFESSYNDTNTVATTITGNDVGDAVAPTDRAEAVALVDTTASVAWTIPSTPIGNSYDSPDISTIIQEIVSRSDYNARNAIQVLIKNAGTNKVKYVVPPTGADCPQLIITYSSATSIYTAAANTDDKSWDATTLTDNVSPNLMLGYNAVPAAARIYLRFPDIGIAQGSIVSAAKLTVYCNAGGAAGTLKVKFYGHASDGSTAPGTVVAAETLAKTTAYVEYLSSGAWSQYYPYEITGLASIVQEILDRPGWSSGSALALIGVENGGDSVTRAIYCYNDGSPEYYATLEITAETVVRNNMSGTMGRMTAYGTGSVPPEIVLSLPALKIVAEGVISHRAEVTLPKLSLSSYGTAYLFPPGLNVYADIYLPALTLDISSSIGSNVAAILPALTALGYTAYISGDNLLAPMTIEGIGNVIEQASLSSSLACLTISASGLLGEVSNVDITLPALAISGISTFVLSGNAAMILPHLVMYESRGRYSNRFTGYVLRYIRP